MTRQILVVAVAVLVAIMLLPAALATTVVVNSDDWMDVYSGMEYAYLNGYGAKFMTSKQYTVLLPEIIPKKEHVLVIESQKAPFAVNLAGSLQRMGYDTETIYASGGRATNIELAKLTHTARFIVIDPAYGYNAISVIPYALLTGAYVILADNKNIDQALAFLNNQSVESLLLYGQLEEGLEEQLAKFNPEIINTGGRYKDNLEIIRKYIARVPSPQLLLSDGSLIEDELMSGGRQGEVNLLIGKDAAPDYVIAFLKGSTFRSAVLIGNHLSQSAKRLKDSTGVPVFIKFGQGITRGTEAEPVKALDTFPLPIINLALGLGAVQYNALSKNIEVTYANTGVRAFVTTSVGILANGQRVLAVGDKDIQRISTNTTIGFQYPADLTEYVANKQNLTVDLLALYGESPDTLDRAIAMTAPLQVVSASDECALEPKELQYNPTTQRFLLTVENTGAAECYATIEFQDVIVNDKPTAVAYPGTVQVKEGDEAVVEIKQRMTPVDIADNPEVNVRMRFGQRQDFLLNSVEQRLPLKEYTGSRISPTTVFIAIIGLLLLVIIVMFLMLRKRGKKE